MLNLNHLKNCAAKKKQPIDLKREKNGNGKIINEHVCEEETSA